MDRRYRRRRLVGAGVLVAIVAGAAAVAALAYRHFNRSETPPPIAMQTISVTIPEGYDRAQTAELAREEGLRGDYVRASVSSPYLDPARYGGKDAKDLEGFLFPDTFE